MFYECPMNNECCAPKLVAGLSNAASGMYLLLPSTDEPNEQGVEAKSSRRGEGQTLMTVTSMHATKLKHKIQLGRHNLNAFCSHFVS